MKKTLLLVLIALALATGVWAQETTWTNPKVTTEGLIPKSMLSDLTSGLLYDEIDAIVLSPAELSNYTGYGLFTAYSNFDFYWNTGSGPAAGAVNPFVPAASGYGRYLVGATLPAFGLRMGAFAGAQLNSTGLLDTNNDFSADASSYEASRVDTADAFTIGTADFSTILSLKSAGSNSTNKFAAAAGVDLGFMGVSLLANVESNVDAIAATTRYNWTVGTDAAYVTPNNTITEYRGLIGKADPTAPADASAETYTRQANKWYLAFTGELPIPNLPLTARLGVGGGLNANLTFFYPYTRVWTVTNVPGAAATTDTRSGYTVGGLFTNGTGAFFVTDVPADEDAFDVATLNPPLTVASDPSNFTDSDIYGRVGGYVDPTFKLADVVSLKARAGVDYKIDSVNANPATISVVDYSNTMGGTGHYRQTATGTAPQIQLTHGIDLDVGGVLVFSESTKLLTAEVGFFYIPNFSFMTVTYGNAATATVTTYSETAPTTPDATGIVVIGPITGLGTRTDTTSYATTGANGVATLTHELNLPVAVRVNVIPDKLMLIGAFQLDHKYTVTTTWDTRDVTATPTTTVLNSAGTDVTPAATAAVTHSASTSSLTAVTANAWSGTPQFMVRWIPLPQLTVDLWGQSIMTAINQTLANFNPQALIVSLGLNVSFRF